MSRVRSPEAKRELAKVWPPEMIRWLKAISHEFGTIEEIEVLDERTDRHMREWNANRGRETLKDIKAKLSRA